MSEQHTPGPWRIENGGDNIIRGPNDEFVCCDGTGAFIAIPNNADARLIAAAPELLDALLGLCEFSEAAGFPTDKARAAIAKATGQEANNG